MKLSEIIRDCDVVSILGHPDPEIGGLTNDSRRVKPGDLFVAVNGCGNDGRAYIDKAIENGAAAVMLEDFEDTTAPATESGAEIGFSSNCTKNNSGPPAGEPSVRRV